MISLNVEGPCDWPWTPCPCTAFDELIPDLVDDVVELASFQLWAATGKVYGPCEVSVLPCGDPFVVCGVCYDSLRSCGCRSIPEIRLDGPVVSIIEVVIDGVTLADTAYRVEDYQWLVRTDGGTWPSSANQLDPNAFRVDYMMGIPPPAGAGIMVGTLACEIAKAMCNDDTCRLPRRAKQITRQGVRVEWSTSDGFGLPEVDQWVANANMPILAGAVNSPDRPLIRRITWEASASPASPGSP